MVRPRLRRRVGWMPAINYFKPAGIPLSQIDEVRLSVEESEAIRLHDAEKIEQEKAAKKMGISQPTFSRLLDEARNKVAKAIVKGLAIRIEGGNYKMVQPRGRFGARQGRGFGARGAGMGMGRRAGGPPLSCVCPVCENQQVKIRGMPCAQLKCPKCGALMVRSD